jgi:two-component system response regulator AtoC
MQAVLGWIGKVAAADTNVCLYGESGTGKELVARAIHSAGPRASHPLIVFDCAAIPDGLMESELFGHVKGAFTSAVAEREGVFQLADGGTLFLDEVGELPLPLQAKLLRVIQCREFRRVGGTHPLRVNVRLIAATNQDLRARVQAGTFREDLFYRLDVIPLTLPPLRERKEDIPLLVDHFIAKFNRNNKKQIRGVSARTLRTLLRYAWPGNIRELENCIERAAVLTDGEILDLRDLAQLPHPPAAEAPPPEPASLRSSLKDRERALILQTLQSVQGNRTRAADLLGISLRSLYYKLKATQHPGDLFAPTNGHAAKGNLPARWLSEGEVRLRG